jgi:hypothetical protein
MLLSNSRAVRERLTNIESAKANVEEAMALSAKGKELEKLAAKVLTISGRNRILREQGVSRSANFEITSVLQIVSLSSQRFAEAPKSTTLVGGQRWTKLVSALENLATSADTLQKQDWVAHFASRLFAGVPPEQRKQTIVESLPENKLALDSYARLYQRFNRYRNAVPTTTDEFDKVHEWSNELGAIQFVENDDVPGPVKAFFNAISSGSGASLEFLTPEVVGWLRTKNMLVNYVVRAR